MINKNKDQRVVVLVDVQNLYYSAKNLFDAKVNFGHVLEDIVSGRKLIRALAYVIRAEVGKEAAFFEALESAGFDIREKDLQVFVGGAKKGDWDVGIAMDAIRYASKADSIILVSGDGDFVPLVQYLKIAKGCIVELVAFDKTCSSDLKDEVDSFLDLESNKKRYLIQNKKSRTTRSAKQSTSKSVVSNKLRSSQKSSDLTKRTSTKAGRKISTNSRSAK